MQEFTFNEADFLSDDNIKLEFDMKDFNFEAKTEQAKTRVKKPTFAGKPIAVEYKNAKTLARQVTLQKGEQIHSVVKGDFIFGDFLEALLVEKNVYAESVYLSTLSLSQENADSLAGLMDQGFIGNLTVMVSNYFYSHEKHRILKYLIEKCDIGNRFQVIVVRNHTKITLMEIADTKVVMTGSSNLRSSRSIEQFCLQESEELFDFYKQLFTDSEGFGIIDHGVPK